MKFNTALAAAMEFLNFALENKKEIGRKTIEKFLILLAPFTPHLTEELWYLLGNKNSIHNQSWPKYDAKLIQEEKIIFIVQVNGKLRDRVEVTTEISEKEIKELALSLKKVQNFISGKEIKKIILVPKKLINIVV